MKKIFKGKLFNRLETLGQQTFNHVGCEGDNEQFIDFLTQFVPELGDQRKVKFTIEALEETKKVESYKKPKDYVNK
ncbi:MAG: hypothetical protein PHG49_00995 [Candidatus Pacebacteria bacterium]|nr:hypothetical protein [Candidatus Paceibacterota bacterium]